QGLDALMAARRAAGIKALTLDLDDTLWPIWPAIERAEHALHGWLAQNARATAQRQAATATRHPHEHLTQRNPESESRTTGGPPTASAAQQRHREKPRNRLRRAAGERPLGGQRAWGRYFSHPLRQK
ncbi:MAG: hypothetical protein ABIQ87_14535, partial [Rubrivivax sp.]